MSLTKRKQPSDNDLWAGRPASAKVLRQGTAVCSRVGKSVLGSVLGRGVGLMRESLAHRPRSVSFL